MPNRFESSPQPEKEIYNEEDLERWQEGAKAWGDFWEKLPHSSKGYINPSQFGGVQAMFLGEKPATIGDRFAMECAQELKEYGFEQNGLYVYSPELVARTIERYPDIFEEWHLTTPEMLIEELNKADLTEMATVRGLILGFPLESIQEFEKEKQFKINEVSRRLLQLPTLSQVDYDYLIYEYFGNPKDKDKQGLLTFFERQLAQHTHELGIWPEDIPQLMEELKQQLQRRIVNVYGVYWVDNGYNLESEHKQVRLKAAFEKSGITENI